jgi:hypothetical protein
MLASSPHRHQLLSVTENTQYSHPTEERDMFEYHRVPSTYLSPLDDIPGIGNKVHITFMLFRE